MKKLMFVLAFAFAATLAFATNPPVDAAIPSGEEPKTADATVLPCIVCKICKELMFCKIAEDCEDAREELMEELEKQGCGGPKKDENQGND